MRVFIFDSMIVFPYINVIIVILSLINSNAPVKSSQKSTGGISSTEQVDVRGVRLRPNYSVDLTQKFKTPVKYSSFSQAQPLPSSLSKCSWTGSELFCWQTNNPENVSSFTENFSEAEPLLCSWSVRGSNKGLNAVMLLHNQTRFC